jgi:excisionase family DNA binding protein
MSASAAHERDDLAERIAALEANYTVIRALLHEFSAMVSGGPPVMTGGDVTTIKGAAFITGYSQTMIRKLIARDKIGSTKIGGRVLIDKATLPQRVKKAG